MLGIKVYCMWHIWYVHTALKCGLHIASAKIDEIVRRKRKERVGERERETRTLRHRYEIPIRTELWHFFF